MATSYQMMNDPDVLTQCIDIDLEFETPACSQPFQPIRMDSQLEREPGECFCILADSAGSSLAKPVTNDTFFGCKKMFDFMIQIQLVQVPSLSYDGDLDHGMRSQYPLCYV